MKLKGFIDIHTHGISRYDTRTENPEDILKIAELHASSGTAAILPTIYSGTIQQMRGNMEAVRKAMEIQGSNPPLPPFTKGWQRGIKNSSLIPRPLSLILGVHLEGPFLNPVRCGAQDEKFFIKPTVSSLKKIIDGYENIIKVITIAPELPGALKVIEKCSSLGIKVNMGHSDATYKQALDGKKAGAAGITHIFNAMRPFHHREPGLIGFGLLDEDIYFEVIADSVHIDTVALKLIFRTKRLDRIILVSDSVKGKKDKRGRIYSKPGVLAGSSITISQAVRNIIKIGIPESIAIESAFDNPKRYLGV